MSSEMLSAEELSSRLKLRPNTLLAWARRGKIPSVKLGRKTVRFSYEAVVAVIDKARENAENN